MKNFIFTLFLCLLGTSMLWAQNKERVTIKNTYTFAQKYAHMKPLVIDTRGEETIQLSFRLAAMPPYIWKHHPETESNYNNHPMNPLAFNRSNGWEMIRVTPLKYRYLDEVVGLAAGTGICILLEALSNAR